MRTLFINAKCSDLCQTVYHDEVTGKTIDVDGYVPEGLGVGGGDYVELTIDIDTGKVVGWESFAEKVAINALKKV